MSQSDFVSRGQALVAAGQFQEAVKVCRLGLLGRPTTVEGRVVLGQALLALKRFDEVLAEMRVALELDHSSIPAQVLKAEALLRKGDVAPAIEALHKARQAAPGDPRIMQLLGEAENGPAQRPSVTHPAVGFIGSGDTKHYPGHPGGGGFEDGAPQHFTAPTSMSSPGSAKRSSKKRAAEPAPEPTPSPDVLEIGERTGTVEVDPDLEGVEVDDELDFDDLAAPPQAAKPAAIGGDRGAVMPSRVNPARPTAGDGEKGTALGRKPKPAGGKPADAAPAKGKNVPPPRSKPTTAPPPMALGARAPVPPAAPLPPAPRAPMAAAMSVPVPQPFSVPTAPANKPTMAMAPPPPLQQDQLFGDPPAGTPAWANATIGPPQPFGAPQPFGQPPFGAQPFGAQQPMPGVDPRSRAAANEPTARPAELDPAILALMSGQPAPNPAMALEQGMGSSPGVNTSPGSSPGVRAPKKTGVRKSRSKLQLFVWVIVGIVVIGGGVFAGFQIRAMRLAKQIVAARQRATDLAKADTWKGWRDARNSLGDIANASPTLVNRAALARTRALIAYEFGDGIADAKADVDALGGQGGLDGELAAAYLALAQNDVKAAKLASDAASASAPDDAGVHYVAGQIALLGGDVSSAVTHLKAAFDKEARPLYGVGLAHAQAAAYDWDDAIATLDKVFAGTADHPAAAIERGMILTASGRIFPGSALANEVRAQLDRVVTQGKRPLNEQQHGVSPAEVAYGHIALAEVNFMRNDKAARNDLKVAAAVNLDDERFAEDFTDALYALGDLTTARSAAEHAVKSYPGSRRARITLARVALAQGKAAEAIEVLNKQADVMTLADGLALRGQANLAAGDLASAAADFDTALKKVPHHEAAVVGRTWVELATGNIDAATKRAAERYNTKGSSPSLTIVYAATLRRSADAAQRDTAQKLLEKLVGTATGFDLSRAQLELARMYRDQGDYRNARQAFASAATGGSLDARLEYALLLIEDRDPNGGRETLEALLKEAGEQPSPQLVIETARARMLVGAHTEAQQLLDLADKMNGIERWKLDRERGRLALRKSDFPAAAAALTRALDGCGADGETFLLAADAGVYEKALADKIKKLAPERLKGRPEAKIVEGKLLIAAEKLTEAAQAYRDAKTGLKAEKASPRRVAQADFGLGLVAYVGQNGAEALQMFELVIDQDPSLVDTYVFAADIVKDPRKAYQYAQRAVQYNPDYPGAWLLVGKLANKLRDRKALAQAIDRLTKLAPNGDELKELKALPR